MALIVGGLLSMPWTATNGMIVHGAELLLAASLLTYAFMPAVIRLAGILGAVDMPDERRVHHQPTPRIGGLAVFLAVNITLLLNFN